MSRNPYPLETCPEHLQLLALAEGTLSESELTNITEHVAECRACDARLGAIEEQSDDLVRALSMLPATDDDEETFQSLQAQLLATPEIFGGQQGEITEAFRDLFREDVPSNLVLPIELGNYELLEQIGAGANGAVFRARHRRLEKQVAIKLLLNIAGPAVEEFLNEMRVIGRLDHPHIIQATDAGEHDGIYFLVMEFVPGLDVSSLIRQHGPLSTPDACEIARQAALGLHFAHKNDLVHRDVKTSNLLLTSAGQVKLLDLGLATISSRRNVSTVSQSGPRGTADYMAPEQWREPNTVTAKADIYSLGCTLYKLLTGSPPFRPLPDSVASLEEAHLVGEVPALTGTRKNIPGSLDAYLRRMLSKDPDDRPASASSVAEVLRKFTAGANLPRLAQAIASDTVPSVDQTVGPHTRRQVNTRRIALLAMLAGLGAVAWRVRRQELATSIPLGVGKWRALSPVLPRLIYLTEQGADRRREDRRSEAGVLRETTDGHWEVNSDSPLLLHFGRPLTGVFRYRVQLRRDDWKVAGGVFFRLQADQQMTHQFQTLELLRSGSVWSLSWNSYARDLEEPPYALAGIDIPATWDSNEDVVELQVALGLSGFPQFSMNGNRILQSEWTISKEARELATAHSRQLATTYVGHIGILHFPGTTTICSPELMYI